MDQKTKKAIKEERQYFVSEIQSKAEQEAMNLEKVFNRTKADIARMSPESQAVHKQLYSMRESRREELELIKKSPFYSRMSVKFDELNGEIKIIYIGKFSLPEAGLYSWVTPVAALRFSELGNVQYDRPSGIPRTGDLMDREMYTIADGNITYLSREDREHGKTLVYQSHFSEQLGQFGLAEVVAQMEKMQDKIIRSEPKGSFLIAGPAGSGKTTVALHRIAFLRQAPQTAESYPASSVIVFVQDKGTKDYFGKLLPSLGIHDVKITTFSEWSQNILELEDYKYIRRYGDNFEEQNRYEFWKVRLLENTSEKLRYFKDPFTTLRQVYKNLPSQFGDLFDRQKEERVIDKQDLTLLLYAYKSSKGSLEENQRYYVKQKGSTSVVDRKYRKVSIKYSAIIVDEFQNYTPRQLEAIRSVLSEDTNTIMYVGDLNQQTHIGSIQSWEDIGEDISPEREVRLSKVYRNSTAILVMLNEIGYNVQSTSLNGQRPEGKAVFVVSQDTGSQISNMRDLLEESLNDHIAILALDNTHLDQFKNEFKGENIHVMTVAEAQGLEFDVVFVVGLTENVFDCGQEVVMPEDYESAHQDTVTDYLYVACTRAKRDLYIFANKNTQDLMKKFVTKTLRNRS